MALTIDDVLRDMKTQKQWEDERIKYIDRMRKKHQDYLEDYISIPTKKMYDTILEGGYVRYVSPDDELKWGGILLKKYTKNEIDYMILANSQRKCITVSFYRNIIFYKKHTTASDKNRKLFISYLDKVE